MTDYDEDDDFGAMGPRAAELLRQRQMKVEKETLEKEVKQIDERPLVEGRGVFNEHGGPPGFQDHFNFGDVSNISIEQSFDDKQRKENAMGRDGSREEVPGNHGSQNAPEGQNM